jgi:phosphate transport system protein
MGELIEVDETRPIRLAQGNPTMSMPHTMSAYERELTRLEDLVVGMGLYGISQLERAMLALQGRDSAVAASVIAGDIREDTLESEVDDLAVRLIALRQPVASDLRQVTCAFKAAVHLERIGDYAVHVAKRSLALPSDFPAANLLSIPRMGDLTLKMLRDTIRAYREKDLNLAVETWRSDEALDAVTTVLLREIVTFMKDDPKAIDAGTHLMFIAKNLERVGDQATNICELIYYRISGNHLPRERPKIDGLLPTGSTAA